MPHQKRIFRFISTIICCLGFKLAAHAQPVVLYIAVYDQLAYEKNSTDLALDHIRQSFPQAEIIEIRPESFKLGWSIFSNQVSQLDKLHGLKREALIKDIRSKIEVLKQLPPIDYLVIGTHGSTEFRNGNSFTSLDGLGEFSEKDTSVEFREIFNPLVKYFSKDMAVLLDTCSAFCGSQGQLERRAETLMRYLGAINGQIWGTTTTQTNPLFTTQNTDLKRNLYVHFSGLKTSLQFAVGLGVPAAGMYAMMSFASMGQVDWVGTAKTSMVIAAFINALPIVSTLMYRLVIPGLEKLRWVNQGLSLTLEKGRVISKTLIPSGYEKVYGNFLNVSSCRRRVTAP